jgi:hypothetical protein
MDYSPPSGSEVEAILLLTERIEVEQVLVACRAYKTDYSMTATESCFVGGQS